MGLADRRKATMDDPAAEPPWFLTELDSATVDPALPVVAVLEMAYTIISGGGNVTVVLVQRLLFASLDSATLSGLSALAQR